VTRFERVRVISAKYGATLAEYLVLHIATTFAMTPEQAAASLTTMLAKTPHADMDGPEAIRLCAEREWVRVTPAGLLQLTEAGLAIAHGIGKELTAPSNPDTK
jgi:hypothetical protein